MEVADNILKKLRGHDEGLKNDEDIYDLTTYQDLERAEQEIKQRIGTLQVLPEQPLSLEQEQLLQAVKAFVSTTSDAFNYQCWMLIEQCLQDKTFSPQIVELIREKGFDLPQFKFLLDAEGLKFLAEVNLKADLTSKEAVLVFNLPKPMAQWWFKGGVNEWGSSAINTGAGIYPWGMLYRRLMLSVWDCIDKEQGLILERLNDGGQHDPGKYYYIWKVSQLDPNKRFANHW